MNGSQSALSIATAVRNGDVSAVSVTEAALADIAGYDARYNCFTTVTAERALQEAKAVDDARARGEVLPPLAGVPYAVKNLFDIVGLPTLAGGDPLPREAMLQLDLLECHPVGGEVFLRYRVRG